MFLYNIGTLPCAVEGMWRVGTGEFLKRGGAGTGVGAPDVTGTVIAAVIVAVDVDDAVVVITCGNVFYYVSVEYTSHCQTLVSSKD